MKKLFFVLFLFSSTLLITCQKELSYETGGVPSHGSLQDDGSGDCLPKTVNGTYVAGTALAATNTIQVAVNVTKTGKYTVFSDTVNGYYFRATGIFSTLGSNSVTLKGFGNPAASGINNFLIQYDSTACNVAVTVLPTGSGGPASFTIQSSGTPAVCSTSGATGNYIVGTALGVSNTDTFNVNITTIGTYNVTSDTVNGIYFNGTGTFIATGSQKLVLYGHGTPTGTAGTVTLHVTAGSSTCAFTVTVTSGAVGTLGGAGGTCTPATPAGTYTQGVALTSGNTVQIQITTTTAGAYSITTNTVSGFSFAASGNATLGSQPITLTGTGTPTASGAINFTVTFGTSTCSFTINVAAAANTDYFPLSPNSWWSYDDVDGIFVNNPGDSLTRVNINSSTIAGFLYRLFQNQDNVTPMDSSYYRRAGNDYLEFNTVDYYSSITFNTPILDSIFFLQEGLTTGATWVSKTWSGTFNGGATSASLKYADTCYDANGTATINGNTFNNVYKIKWRPMVNIGAGFQSEFLAFESWYAKGVGLIYFKVIDLTNSQPPSAINILHWHVF